MPLVVHTQVAGLGVKMDECRTTDLEFGNRLRPAVEGIFIRKGQPRYCENETAGARQQFLPAQSHFGAWLRACSSFSLR